MIQRHYQAQQVPALLKTMRSKQASGMLQLNAQINAETTRSRVFVWRNGEITYGGYSIPDKTLLIKKLVQQFKPSVSEVALKFALEKRIEPASIRQPLDILCKIRVLTWEKIESFVQAQTVIALEQVLPYAGEFQFNRAIKFDLCYGQACHGLDWSKLKLALARRKEGWTAVTPMITSMDAVPRLPQEGLNKVSTLTVRQHLQQWVDGKRSLVDIAEKVQQDPLQIARLYLTWAQTSWVVFADNPITCENKELPNILSVDDSPIIQTLVKRVLGDRYNVLLASNATDALNLLSQKSVQLLLLDVTMPDIDGLEMCRTVRSIPKFRSLPIVMLTARDTYVDKMKGQIAGTNRYLTKPFDAEKLLNIVSELLKNGNA